MIRPIPILAWLLGALLVVAPAAAAHGGSGEQYRASILSIEPSGLPVDVRIVDDDRVRFEHAGDEEIVLCGYGDGGCEEWVRISDRGVLVDHNARSFFANLDVERYGDVPEDAGTRPDWKLVRERPAAYTYHDHRLHWMGRSLPPNVDESDPDPQEVFESEIAFRYGDTDGVVRTRLEYVGGRSWVQRYGEQAIIGGGVAAMLLAFLVDARRRRARTSEPAGGVAAPVADADEGAHAAAGSVDEHGSAKP